MGFSLTRVLGSDGSVVVEVAAIVSHAVFEKIVVEGKRCRILHAARVVAGPTVLDWAAVRAAGTAGPVERDLQRRVLCVVLRHAPQLLRRSAAVGGFEERRETQ